MKQYWNVDEEHRTTNNNEHQTTYFLNGFDASPLNIHIDLVLLLDFSKAYLKQKEKKTFNNK